MYRPGNIQEVLVVMAPELLMTHVAQIRKLDPDASNENIASKMISDAYAICVPDFEDKIMGLNYEETKALEIELKRMAMRSIDYHNQWLELEKRLI